MGMRKAAPQARSDGSRFKTDDLNEVPTRELDDTRIMRPGPNNKRPRGRGRGGKQHHHNAGGGGGGGRQPDQHFNIHRTIDSNGPDIKIRGNAHHIYEKYLQLARDANSSGDRVMAENYLQHAEHYYRLIMAAQAAMPQPNQGQGGQPQMGGQPYGNGGGGQQQQPQQANYNNGGNGQYRQPNGMGPQPTGGEVNGNVSDGSDNNDGNDRYNEEEGGRYD
jgi:hypothetical protein